ncbi:SPOR domain-containing protein [Oxalobacter sp. OttesenSCG-928-P03]|nr:SPOR domain-containing protein [Oxalobacter sp. OttesenSCG-928-P03]
MLKIFFWILVAANIVLFVFQRTYFDAPSSGKREPERLTYQYREDKVRLLSAEEINRAVAQARVAAQTQDMAVAGHCVEVGYFAKTEAAGFARQLHSLSLGPEDITLTPRQEGSTYMVFIPPSPTQKSAEEKIAGLKEKGIESYYLIKDQTKMRWAISLGVFKTRDAAATYAASLEKSGLTGLEIAPRGPTVEKLLYRLDHLNEEQMRALESIMGSFPAQSIRQCQPTPSNRT